MNKKGIPIPFGSLLIGERTNAILPQKKPDFSCKPEY
jgi:hypothetical protein